MLFFVLSGFVLSLPALDGRPQPYFTFVIRRIFRIYVPYLVPIAFSVAGAFWLHGVVTQSMWFHRSWSEPVNWSLVGRHLFFVGAYDTNQFDNPIWSLVQEMRISLVFPALCWLVLRWKSRWSAAIAASLTAIAFACTRNSITAAWLLPASFYYGGLFVLGIAVARDRDRLGAWFKHFRRPARILIGLACLWLYLLAGPELRAIGERYHPLAFWYLSYWITALGAGGLIVISLHSASSKKVLSWSPIRFLGRMSYSLYLWHFVVLLYCVHLLYRKAPFDAILCLTFVLSIAVSWCSYRWIELPSIALGRKVGDVRSSRLVEAKV